MAYDFPFVPVVGELRTLCKIAWDIPDGNPIFQTGAPVSLQIKSANLPMAVLQAVGEFPIQRGPTPEGGSAKTLTETMEYLCWLFRPTNYNDDDLISLIGDLSAFGGLVMTNIKLNGTVCRTWVTGFNWSGEGAAWPIDIEEGIGVIGGYVRIRPVIIDL